jgi:hypothetical protein
MSSFETPEERDLSAERTKLQRLLDSYIDGGRRLPDEPRY